MRRSSRRLLLLVAALPVTLVVLALLYMLGMAHLEHDPRGFWRSLEWAGETITTTGYGADARWEHPVMVVFTIATQFVGVLMTFLVFPVFLIPYFEERFEGRLPTRLPQRPGTVLVYGWGPSVATLVDDLGRARVPVVILEPDLVVARRIHDRGRTVVHADLELADAILGDLRDVRGIVANAADHQNAVLTLSARQRGFAGPIIALVETPSRRAPMTRAGATAVFTQRHALAAAGAAKASVKIRPRVSGELRLGNALEIAEVRVHRGSALVGTTLAAARLRTATGATIVACTSAAALLRHRRSTPNCRSASSNSLAISGRATHGSQLSFAAAAKSACSSTAWMSWPVDAPPGSSSGAGARLLRSSAVTAVTSSSPASRRSREYDVTTNPVRAPSVSGSRTAGGGGGNGTLAASSSPLGGRAACHASTIGAVVGNAITLLGSVALHQDLPLDPAQGHERPVMPLPLGAVRRRKLAPSPALRPPPATPPGHAQDRGRHRPAIARDVDQAHIGEQRLEEAHARPAGDLEEQPLAGPGGHGGAAGQQGLLHVRQEVVGPEAPVRHGEAGEDRVPERVRLPRVEGMPERTAQERQVHAPQHQPVDPRLVGPAILETPGACADVRFMANEGLAWLPDGRLITGDDWANGVVELSDPLSPSCTARAIAGTARELTGTDSPPGRVYMEGDVEGPGATARFAAPDDAISDDAGNVYVWDRGNKKIKRIANDAMRTVTTVFTLHDELQNVNAIAWAHGAPYAGGINFDGTRVIKINVSTGAIEPYVNDADVPRPDRSPSAASLPITMVGLGEDLLLYASGGYLYRIAPDGSVTHAAGMGTRNPDLTAADYAGTSRRSTCRCTSPTASSAAAT